MALRIALLCFVAHGTTARASNQTLTYNGPKETCIIQAIGDAMKIAPCLSCAKQCSEAVFTALTELRHFDLDPAAWLKAKNVCMQCVAPCEPIAADLIVALCMLGKAACHTDFCATCCGYFHGQKGVCLGNDFNIACAPPDRECECGPGSGNPHSCCTRCPNPNNPSSCGGGAGKNTGNFCGNDFHSKACYGDSPICCTNDVGQPACCPRGAGCHSPLLGNNGCRGGDFANSSSVSAKVVV